MDINEMPPAESQEAQWHLSTSIKCTCAMRHQQATSLHACEYVGVLSCIGVLS